MSSNWLGLSGTTTAVNGWPTRIDFRVTVKISHGAHIGQSAWGNRVWLLHDSLWLPRMCRGGGQPNANTSFPLPSSLPPYVHTYLPYQGYLAIPHFLEQGRELPKIIL